ncbi:hypothetical protein BVG79_01099 [Ketogulonicigenium robustum]|uniref:Uncharacterized protein n=1 Tax=Ketogulonicigenium robustum TaxID=92947 RepID=A0A1W6NYX1_9RHOB|nr:hypothetical protein [Ketogulonicigenium robustum]ARO14445.1 hypothetical protein BVG79_01099 [Ketogulonicigenium robustum]
MAKRYEVIVERDSGATSVAVLEVIDALPVIEAAPQAARDAEAAALAAELSRASALASEGATRASEQVASEHADNAMRNAARATTAATSSENSATAAIAAATAAEESAERIDLGALDDAVAATAADRAATGGYLASTQSLTVDAENAASIANAAKEQSEANAATAAGFAGDAAAYALQAQASQSSAADRATMAANSAASAAESAEEAAIKAGTAQTSAASAAVSATSAASQASAAEVAASDAASNATNALAAARLAEDSRDLAAASAFAASESAENAEALLAGKADKAVVDDLAAKTVGPRDADSGQGVTWILFDRNSNALAGWDQTGARIILSDETVADITRRIDLPEVDLDAKADKADVEALAAETTGPRDAERFDDVAWVLFDVNENALVGWDQTGARIVLSDDTIDNIGRRLDLSGPIDTDFDVSTGFRLSGLAWDSDGNVVIASRPDGLDMIMAQAFWDRGRAALGIDDPPPEPQPGDALSKTAWQIISVQGQSLSVFGPYSDLWNKASVDATNASLPGYALQLAGLTAQQETDPSPVAINSTVGARARDYVKTTRASGVAQATTDGTLGAAWPLAALVNLHRADLGVDQVPVLTTAHGISGVAIENIDPYPETGTGITTIWDNMVFWYGEAARVAAEAGKSLTVPWHDWVHGTSAAQYPAGSYIDQLWDYRRNYLAMLQDTGIEGGTLMILSQPGGNANTSHVNMTWHCVDEIELFCAAGGGVLATPEYAYQIADNNVHPDAYWTLQFQEVKAWAIAEIEAGRQWQILRPTASVAGNVVTLQFDLRPDEYLVAHDANRYGGVGIDGNLGFTAVGANITGTVLRGHQVVLTCDGTPTAIHYAFQKQDVRAVPDNLWNAHRGLLRTSLSKPSKVLAGVQLYRWAPSFRLPL